MTATQNCVECSRLTLEPCGLCVECQMRAATGAEMQSAFGRCYQQAHQRTRQRAQSAAAQTPGLPGLEAQR